MIQHSSIWAVKKLYQYRMVQKYELIINVQIYLIFFFFSGTICAGDFRFAQTPPLACMHSLFYNMHNVVVKHLKRLNRHWCTNKLLWESRRITIACYQHITYYEWLPLVLGTLNILTTISF